MSTTPTRPPGWDPAAELARKQADHLSIHGGVQTFAMKGGISRNVWGIFRWGDDFEKSEPGSDAAFWVRKSDLSDITDGPHRGDQVIVNLINFTVHGDPREAGDGGVWMNLVKTVGA